MEKTNAFQFSDLIFFSVSSVVKNFSELNPTRAFWINLHARLLR